MEAVARGTFKGIPVVLYDEEYTVHGENWFFDLAFSDAIELHNFFSFFIELAFPENYSPDFPIVVTEILDGEKYGRSWGRLT